jgi:diphosphomevalonate decarboxylase
MELTPVWEYGILLSMNPRIPQKPTIPPPPSFEATALAHPNIAFIKYWGLRDAVRKIPKNGSISMNLGCLSTRTTIRFNAEMTADRLILNGEENIGAGRDRVRHFLDRVRQIAGSPLHAEVISENNFPAGAGIASSASAFAALALAATRALGLQMGEAALSTLASYGSGSASRSIPGGFVEWQVGKGPEETYAKSIAPKDHWDLRDCIAILSRQHKAVGSEEGMKLADSSPFQAARVADADRRLDLCRSAIRDRDFGALARVTELDSNMMHAVMMTSHPPLFYWQPESLAIMKAIRNWQKDGLAVTYTLDAGPNVHVICLPEAFPTVVNRLREMPGVQIILNGRPAGPARLMDTPLQS